MALKFDPFPSSWEEKNDSPWKPFMRRIEGEDYIFIS
jgi:hypothetical protein